MHRLGAGTWVGEGAVSRTKPSSTLFVTMIPSNVSMVDVEAVFKDEPGYFAFRTVRQMVFIDFNSIGGGEAF